MPGHHLRALKVVTKKLAPVPPVALTGFATSSFTASWYQFRVYLKIRANINIH